MCCHAKQCKARVHIWPLAQAKARMACRVDAFAANSGSQVLRRTCIPQEQVPLSTASRPPEFHSTALNYGFTVHHDLIRRCKKIAKNGTLILCAATQSSARRPCTFGRQHKPRPAWPVEWSPLLRTWALRCCGGPALLRSRGTSVVVS